MWPTFAYTLIHPSFGDFESPGSFIGALSPMLPVSLVMGQSVSATRLGKSTGEYQIKCLQPGRCLGKKTAKKRWSYLWLWWVGWVGWLGGWVVDPFGFVFPYFCLWVGFVIAGWLLMKLYHSLLWFLDRVTLEQRRRWRWRQGSPWYQGFLWQERSPPWFLIRQAPSPSLAWTWQQCGSPSYEFEIYQVKILNPNWVV